VVRELDEDAGWTRRSVVAGGFGMAALLSLMPAPATGAGGSAGAGPLLIGPIDLRSGQGTAATMARITGNTRGATKHGWYRGRMMGVAPGGAVRDLLGVKGMSSQRLVPLDDRPGWILLQKEVGFFFDLASGDVVDEWSNPYSNELVRVMHIANPSVSRTIEPVVRDPRFYDDPDAPDRDGRPFLLPWRRVGDRLFVEHYQHFWVPNPLDPGTWKRESSGPMIQVSDMMSFNVRVGDVADDRRTSLDHWGSWVHVRPWQPWMLMADSPGHLLYNCFTGGADTLDELPSDIVELTSQRFPEFLAPPERAGKPEPSIIRFMRERTPAPVGEDKP
jgi:hypothetical protein